MPRIVLYAEGRGETGFVAGLSPSPTRQIDIRDEGSAHTLVRRCCCELLGWETNAVRFERPLRYKGREVRGSDLLNRTVLRSVLTWPMPDAQPDVAAILVDQDGHESRKTTLAKFVEEPPLRLPPVVAVAVQEFESWPIADHAAMLRVLESKEQQGRHPESLEPGEAKARLAGLVANSHRESEAAAVRHEIARAASLQVISRTCRSFKRFVDDLKRALPAAG